MVKKDIRFMWAAAMIWEPQDSIMQITDGRLKLQIADSLVCGPGQAQIPI